MDRRQSHCEEEKMSETLDRTVHVIILHKSATARKGISLHIGESLLLRHLRMLRDCLIPFVTILTDDPSLVEPKGFAPMRITCQIVSNLCAQAEQLVYDVCKRLSEFGEDALFFDSSCVFSRELFHAITENEKRCLFLVDRTNGADIRGQRAKLDMDHVIQTGQELFGIGTFGLFPLVRMDAEAMAQLCRERESMPVGTATGIHGLLNGLLSLNDFFALSCAPYFAAVLQRHTDIEALSLQVRISDCEDLQSLYTGPGCVLDMIDVLQGALVTFAVVLLDASCDQQLIAYILKEARVSYVCYNMDDGTLNENWYQAAATQILPKASAAIICAGTGKTIDCGKALRLYISLQREDAMQKEALYDSIRLLVAPVGKPCIEAATGACLFPWGHGKMSLFTPRLLPTEVFLDCDLMDMYATQERDALKSLIDAFKDAHAADKDRLVQHAGDYTDILQIWAAKRLT